MAGPSPSVAATRLAVRRALEDSPRGSHVLVAGSGGPDSTALAAAAAFVAPRLESTAGFASADQHWSAGSTDQAKAAVSTAARLGLDPAVIVEAPAERTEGAARVARRRALLRVAQEQKAAAILLGHTLDDQAETVLLRLARGSGARSLSAMAARDDPWRRPFLALRRALVHDSAAELDLTTWDDPSNADPAFARSRVRDEALPLLERTLGPGVADSLARSAGLLRSDADRLTTSPTTTSRAFTTTPKRSRHRNSPDYLPRCVHECCAVPRCRPAAPQARSAPCISPNWTHSSRRGEVKDRLLFLAVSLPVEAMGKSS